MISIAFLSVMPGAASAASKLPISMSASLKNSVCTEGDPVTLSIALHNEGSEKLFIGGSAFEPSAFQITVTDSAGHAILRTAYGDRTLTTPSAASANIEIEISPGGTNRYRFNLSRLFDLSRAGEYHVSVRRIIRESAFSFQTLTAPARETIVTAEPMKLRMVENADARSGAVLYSPPPAHSTFLYMANEDYNRSISVVNRFRMDNAGGVSSTLGSNPLAGKGVASLIATPDGHFLYVGNAGDHTISQFHIGENGVLSPLSPATIPSQRGAHLFVMDPQGRFLYYGGARYLIGKDGSLSQSPEASPSITDAYTSPNTVISTSAVISSNGGMLYACNGLTFGYRLDKEGQITAVIIPEGSSAGPKGGRDTAVALAPSGKFAFVLTDKSYSPGGADEMVVPMRVESDGRLTALPGSQSPRNPITPPPGMSLPACKTLAVAPGGHFLIVLNPNYLAPYKIEENGSLVALPTISQKGELTSVFFGPDGQTVYVLNRNPPSLLPFHLDAQDGLIPADNSTPFDIPFAAELASAAAPSPDQWGAEAGGLTASLRLTAEAFRPNTPIVATVTLKNVSSHTIHLGEGARDLADFHLSLVGPPARRIYPSEALHPKWTAPGALLTAGHDLLEPSHASEPITLRPGEQRQYQLVLSRLADLTLMGSYTVRAHRRLPDGTDVATPMMRFQIGGVNDYPFQSKPGILIDVS